MLPFEVIEPKHNVQPILISVPHCGTKIPENLIDNYDPKLIGLLDDTDWYVDKLYDFASEMGITMIKSVYSRWVIDLNRAADSKPLYNDGRVITGLTPLTDFNNNPLYIKNEPDQAETENRLQSYYYPYYEKIESTLNHLQSRFDHVLFFDAHSIRQYVPGIHPEKFPDLILGDVDGNSAHDQIIHLADEVLSTSQYSYQHNRPFKGGYLTRHFGQPHNRRHGLQLEMSKSVYMDDAQTNYADERAQLIRTTLISMFEGLIDTLHKLNQN